MNRAIILVILLFFAATLPHSFTFCLNVNPVADSLKNLLTNTPKDPDRLELYGKISWAYLAAREDLELGRSYADSLKSLATSINNEKWLKRSLFYYGALERFRGNHHEALEYLDDYVAYFTQAGDSNWVADGLFQMAAVFHNMGEYAKSLPVFYYIINIDRALNNEVNVAHSLQSIGNIYFNIQKYQEAINTYHEALSIYDSLGKSTSKASVYLNLGNVYTKLNEFDKAKQYYNKALEINKKENILYGQALDLANIAYLFDAMEQYDSALYYHLQALELREKLPNKNDLCRSLLGVGRGYRFINQPELAENYLLKALELAKQIDSKPMMRDTYFNLSALYAAKNDYKSAYDYSIRYKTMSDSVLNEESSRQINELQTRYETEKKDRQIAVLAQEKELQKKEAKRQAVLRKALIIGLILLLLLGGSVIYTISQRLKNQKVLAAKNEEVKEANFKRQLTELEMKALRAQINPHFLFNCMNSINRMILAGEAENASRYLTKFSKLVRMILENSTSERVSLENELAMIEAYVQLEELRFKEKICFSVLVDEQVDKESLLLPPMILQPFVENAIWHGLLHREKKEDGSIQIIIKEKGDRLWCTVEDNGVGRIKAASLKENNIYKSKSMGIKISQERLSLLNKDRLQELIHFTDLKDPAENVLGTRVDIGIPIS